MTIRGKVFKGWKQFFFMSKIDNRLMKMNEVRSSDDIANKIKQYKRKIRWKYMPQIIVSSALLSAFALGMIFGRPSKLEREIADYGKAAQECLVKGDTTEAIINIIKGTNKARSTGNYDLFKQCIYPEIEKISGTDFYDKKTGSIIYKGIEVDKPSGTIKYPLRYQHEYFPKETKKYELKKSGN